MFKKIAVASVLAAALVGPAVAQNVNPGLAMQAKLLRVAPGEYTADELARLDAARQEGDTVTEDAILKRSLRSGFGSTYAVDASTLSSSNE